MKFAVLDPIEIRLTRREKLPLVLVASVAPNGVIFCHLSVGGHGQAEALSNLQLKAVVPSKAVVGWHDELVNAVRTGLYPIGEIR